MGISPRYEKLRLRHAMGLIVVPAAQTVIFSQVLCERVQDKAV
jgi:hypothetical protein